MSQQFSNTGIQDGLPIEANEVSQSVDAFTGAKAYDIILSGSLTVSGSTPTAATPGSVKLTGSLVNDGSGQFSHVGISTPAITTNAVGLIMVSDAVGGFDPIALIEGNSGNDIPQLQFSNEDVNWTARIGQPDDNFQILQSGSVNKYPFIIDKDQPDYSLYVANTGVTNKPGSIGINLGINTPTLLADMQYGEKNGELRALQTISGSTFSSQFISASLLMTVNIHGTASHANFIETAQTASYVKSTNIDFFYSISNSSNFKPINANHIASIATGSFIHLKNDSTNGGIFIGNTTEGYNVAISGSNQIDNGTAYLGNPIFDGSNKPQHITFYQNTDPRAGFIKVGDTVGYSSRGILFGEIPGAGMPGTSKNVFASQSVKVSGSGANQVRMDGYDADLILIASNSLEPNDLKFNVNNLGGNDGTARVYNANTGTSSELSVSAGGGGSNANFTAFSVSASSDTNIVTGSLNYGIMNPPQGDEAFPRAHVHAYFSKGWGHDDGGNTFIGRGWEGDYKPISITTSGGTAQFNIGFSPLTGSLPTGLGTKEKIVKFNFCALGMPSSNTGGVYIEKPYVYRWRNPENDWQLVYAGLTYKLTNNANYNFSSIYSFGTMTEVLSFYIQPWSSVTTFWNLWLNVKASSLHYSAL